MASYTQTVTRAKPVLIACGSDRSRSTGDRWSANQDVTIAEAIATAINTALHELMVRCASGGEIRDYCNVALVGYGNDEVQDLLPESLQGRGWASLSQLNDAVESEDGQPPVFIEPEFDGNTPMAEFIDHMFNLVRRYVELHPDCYPPLVMNATDSEFTTESPVEKIRRLTGLATSDGNVQYWHIHVSPSNADAVLFPSSLEELPDDPHARALFECCSPLPPHLLEVARRYEPRVRDGARGFALNADLTMILRALTTGTTLKR